MRHGKKVNHLGRTSSHRKALLSNLATSLIINKRISTTVAKAKELRKYVEPIINRSKTDSTHSRRIVFGYLQNKESVKELFDGIAGKVSARPGGFTRIIRIGNRLGDNAEMCIIELVDYNEIYTQSKEAGAAKAKTRRSRRGTGKGKSEEASEATAENKAAPKAEAKTETKEAKADKSESKKEKPEAKGDQTKDAASEGNAE